jgi:hypothetical protein
MALAAAGTAKMAAKAARREKPSADICGEETRCGAATGEKLATGEKADAEAAIAARTMRNIEIRKGEREITEDSERCELRRLFENIFLELALNCSYVRDRIPLFIGEACRP